MKTIIITSFTALLVTTTCLAQTFGPNSPTTIVNDATVGTLPWSTPGNVITTNDAYAQIVPRGISNYLKATNFGFAIPIPSGIDGIVLGVEKKSLSPANVAVLDNWTVGLTKTISAGTNRMLMVIVNQENGGGVSRTLTSLTYGGQAMTRYTQQTVGTAFIGKTDVWRLNEAGITAATSTTLVPTFDLAVTLENIETFSSATFANVDQISSFGAIQVNSSNSSTNPVTLTTAVGTAIGGLVVSSVFCGSNTTPAVAVGGTNTYTIDAASGFTEVIDRYDANASFTGSGMSFQISNLPTLTATTVNPQCTFNGTPNRQLLVCFNLLRARELDSEVRLVKAGSVVGANKALVTSAWNTVDTYANYPTPSTTDLWGTTWLDTDINNANFGAVISARIQNGTAQVDHMRITVYSHSTLPIELLDFYGESNTDNSNQLKWVTATETNNKLFEIQHSTNGTEFNVVGTIDGKGTSNVLTNYQFKHNNPSNNSNNYYRLKQIDYDGKYSYSAIIAINNGDYLATASATIYPNPSQGFFYLNLQNIAPSTVVVYDANLKVIQTLTNVTNNYQLDLVDYADGEYFISYQENGTLVTKKILKSSSVK